MQNRIESKENMLQWCQKVNHAVSGKYADLQDSFAYSDQNDLRAYFIDMTQNEKELAIFAIQKAMGSATLFDFVRQYSQWKIQEYIDRYEAEEGKELEKMRSELVAERQNFESEKMLYQTKFDGLNKDIDRVKAENTRLIKLNTEYFNRNMDLAQENKEMQESLDKLYAFEGHIKSLLNN